MENIEEMGSEHTELKPKLYLVPTPLGNLGDITLRAKAVLEDVSELYCEDTRNSLKLMNALGIKKPLLSCHQHNEEQRAAEIFNKVSSGKAIAYISDAGMPGVSDPGSRLIRYFIEHGGEYEVLPGGTAAMTAWVMSGLPTDKLYFCGFLPRTGAERKQAIEQLKSVRATIVLYESPLRVGETLNELVHALGNFTCALVREISKYFEETVRGDAESLAKRFIETPPKGECVLVIDHNQSVRPDDDRDAEVLTMLLNAGCSCRDAAEIAGNLLNKPKNRMYKLALELSKNTED